MTNTIQSLKYNEHYRPLKFIDIIGQKENLNILNNSILTNQIQNAYIFYGGPGVGKTTAGRVFANKLICQKLDDDYEPCGKCDACLDYANNPYTAGVIEIDGASNASVNEIRALKNGVKFAPKYKKNIVIIDEAQDVRGPGASALLKVLEEPPAHTVFILITTDYTSILEAIRSRCSPFYFQSVSPKEIKERLLQICLEQNIEITENAISYIAEGVDGCVRDSIKILQQASIASNKNIKETHLKGLVDIEPIYLRKLLPFVIKNDTASIVSILNTDVEKVNSKDFDFIAKKIRKIIIGKHDLDNDIKTHLIKVANIFLKYKSELSIYPNYKMALEFALIESGSYIEKNIVNFDILSYIDDFLDTTIASNNNIVIADKKEFFLNMLYISYPKIKAILKDCDISLDETGSILKFLTNTDESKNELRKILSSKTPQKIKPLVNLDGFIVKLKEDN